MLQSMRVSLSDADREQYGITEEWLPINSALFVERRVSALREWEQETGVKVMDFVMGDVDARSIELLATTLWLACKLNNVTVPPFADFDPHALAAKVVVADAKPEGDDADPPASSSADTSAETLTPQE